MPAPPARTGPTELVDSNATGETMLSVVVDALLVMRSERRRGRGMVSPRSARKALRLPGSNAGYVFVRNVLDEVRRLRGSNSQSACEFVTRFMPRLIATYASRRSSRSRIGGQKNVLPVRQGDVREL